MSNGVCCALVSVIRQCDCRMRAWVTRCWLNSCVNSRTRSSWSTGDKAHDVDTRQRILCTLQPEPCNAHYRITASQLEWKIIDERTRKLVEVVTTWNHTTNHEVYETADRSQNVLSDEDYYSHYQRKSNSRSSNETCRPLRNSLTSKNIFINTSITLVGTPCFLFSLLFSVGN